MKNICFVNSYACLILFNAQNALFREADIDSKTTTLKRTINISLTTFMFCVVEFTSINLNISCAYLHPSITGYTAAVNQSSKITDKVIASSLIIGSLSSLYFAQQLYALYVNIIIVSVLSFAYPKICKKANENKIQSMILMLYHLHPLKNSTLLI